MFLTRVLSVFIDSIVMERSSSSSPSAFPIFDGSDYAHQGTSLVIRKWSFLHHNSQKNQIVPINLFWFLKGATIYWLLSGIVFIFYFFVALDPCERIGSHGGRMFVLYKKSQPQIAKGVSEMIAPKGGGGGGSKDRVNSSLSFRILLSH